MVLSHTIGDILFNTCFVLHTCRLSGLASNMTSTQPSAANSEASSDGGSGGLFSNLMYVRKLWSLEMVIVTYVIIRL